MEQQSEGMTPQKMSGKVLDKFLVDVFKPKNGNEKDIVVFTFLVNQKESAKNLQRFISKGPFDLIDVEASPAPDEDGNYLVFIEMDRSRDMFGIMDDILQHIDYLVDVHHWRFRPYSHNAFIKWNRDNFVKAVPQNSAEYSGDEPKDKIIGDDDSFPSSKEVMEPNQVLLRQFIDKQINRHSKTYIKSLQDQIHSVIQDNQRLLEHIEELKSEQQLLHQQLEAYQKREDTSQQREEKIYSKIRDLENRVTRFAASSSQNINGNDDSEIATTPLETFQKVDSYEDIEQLVTDDEKDHIEIEDAVDLDATLDLKHEDEFEPDAPGLNEQEEPHIQSAEIEESRDQITDEIVEPYITESAEQEIDGRHPDESDLPLEPPGLSDEYFADENEILHSSSLEKVSSAEIESLGDNITDNSYEGNIDTKIVQKEGNFDDLGDDKIEEIDHIAISEDDDSDDTILEFESILEAEASATNVIEPLAFSEFDHNKDEDQGDEIQQTDLPEDSKEIVHELDTIVEEDLASDEIDVSNIAEYKFEDSKPHSSTLPQQDIAEEPEEVIHDLETIIHADDSFAVQSDSLHSESLNPVDDEAQDVSNLQIDTPKVLEDIVPDLEYMAEEDKANIETTEMALPDQTDRKISESHHDESPIEGMNEDIEDTIHELEAIVDAENTAAGVSKEQNLKYTDSGENKNKENIYGESVNKLFRKGLSAYEKKSYVKAVEYFTKATELAPDQPAGYLNLAIIAYRLKDYETARSHARLAFEYGSKSAEKILDKAETKLEAEREAEKVKGSDFDSQSGKEVYNFSEEQKIESIEASVESTDLKKVRAADEVIELDQSSVVYGPDDTKKKIDNQNDYYSRTEADDLTPDKKSDDTEKIYDSSQAEKDAERDIANEYIALGLAATDQKKYTKAIEYFKKAIKLSPDMTTGHMNLAVLTYRRKDYETARSHAIRAVELGSQTAQKILDKADAKLLNQKNRVVVDTGKTTPQQDLPEIIYKAGEEKETIDTDAGNDTEENERTKEEIAELVKTDNFNELQKAIPEQLQITKKSEDRQDIISTLADTKETEVETSTTKKSNETDERELANKYFAKALAATEKKNYNSAIEYFTKTTELSPNVPAGYLNLAVLNYRIKQYETARKHASRAIELGSHSAKKILEKADSKLKVTNQHNRSVFEDLEMRANLNNDNTVDIIDTDMPDIDVTQSNEENKLLENDVIIFEQPEVLENSKIEDTTKDLMQQNTSSAKNFTTIKDTEDQNKSEALKKLNKGTANERELANEYFRLGEDALEQKAYHKAIKCFEKVTELLPQARRSYIKLAVLYYQLKNYETAKEYAHKALDLGSTSAHKILKRIQKKLDDIATTDSPAESAKRTSEKIDITEKDTPTSQETTDDKIHGDKQNIVPENMQSRIEKVEEDALIQTPGQIESIPQTEPPSKSSEGSVADNYTVNEYFAMGLAASERQEYSQAIEYFTKVTELIPNASSSFLNLANLFYNLKDYDTAQKHAQRALDLGSKSAQRLLDDIGAMKSEST